MHIKLSECIFHNLVFDITWLSQNYPLLKIIITPALKGVLIFSDFHPLGWGKEGDENNKMKLLRQSLNFQVILMSYKYYGALHLSLTSMSKLLILIIFTQNIAYYKLYRGASNSDFAE